MADRNATSDRSERELEAEAREVEISFKPYIDALWESRRIAFAAVLVLTGVFALSTVALWFWAPAESVSTVRFRLLFDGAAQGRYPNGNDFSPAEILAAPVLTEVYNANDLERFGSLPAFKDGLFIQNANPQLELLAYEYQARLTDPRLSPSERANIEQEFRTRSETLIDPTFALSIRRSERFVALPPTLAQKVLHDILTTWAQHAEARKGVLRYEVQILSRNILTADTLPQSDFLVAADRLRAEANRVMQSAEEVAEMPGALTVRTAKSNVSLAEIRARLDDTVRFGIIPLIDVIRAEGLASDPRQFASYASNMVFQLRLDKQLSSARARALEDSLRSYVALNAPRTLEAAPGMGGTQAEGPRVVPQVSDSFVDRIQEMSAVTQKGEMEYRRRLTDQIIDETRQVAVFDRELLYYEELSQNQRSPAQPSPERAAEVRRQILAAFEAVSGATTDLHDLYLELSAQNLNPAARLFAQTGPFTQHTEYAVPFRRLLFLYVFAALVTLAGVPLFLLLRAAIRRRRARALGARTA